MTAFLKLFGIFFGISLFTIGGGYNMIPLMREALCSRGWLAADEFLGFLALAEATPGPIAVNAATLSGARVAGFSGAAAATLGACLPGLVLLLALGPFVNRLRASPRWDKAMAGLLPALAGLLAATAVLLFRSAFPAPRATASFAATAAIFVVSLVLFLRGARPLTVFALAAAAGLLFCRPAAADAEASLDASLPTLRATTMRIRGFDPAQSADEPTTRATGKLYEGLLQYAPYARPYRLQPLLAESMPEISPDGLTYTFRIRKGIRFAPDPCFGACADGLGRELVAEDFVYSFKRIADAAVASSGYWIFRGHIAGLDEWRAASARGPADYDSPVEGLSAPDDRTLVIRLTKPYPQLLYVLAMPYAFAVPREAVERYGDAFAVHPVGTGPYILHDMRPNHHYEYRVSPAWAARDDTVGDDAPEDERGKKLPRIPRIVESVVGDGSTAWLMFLAGELDESAIPRENFDSVVRADGSLAEEVAAKGIALARAPSLAVSYILFNGDDPKLGNNPALRKALSCLFDFEAWKTFQNGCIEEAAGPVPPIVAGALEGPPPYRRDVARAKAFLEEAGYPGGKDPATGKRLQLTLSVGNADSAEARQSAELLQSFFADGGIDLSIDYMNWPSFLEALRKGSAQMAILTWLGDYPDAENFLQLFYGDNGGGVNRANYRNKAFDPLYEKLAALPVGAEGRDELCREAGKLVSEDAAWIFLGYPAKLVLRRTRIKPYEPHAFPWGQEKYRAFADPQTK
jgi:ABC-type transport system substrate-binding protein